MQTPDPTGITFGIRGIEFRKFIINLLYKGKLNEKYLAFLTDDEAMDLYAQAFTNPSADTLRNYEMLEKLGDATCNKVIVWYIYNKFPKLKLKPQGVMLISRISHVLRSKQTFSNIGITLGFEKFISSGLMMVKGGEMKRIMHVMRNSIVEDCFEAFIGATELLIDKRFREGVGYCIVQNIITALLNEFPIPSLRYEDLFDPITRLKELFDYQKFVFKDGITAGLGTFKYIDGPYDEARQLKTVMVEFTDKQGNKSIVSTGQGALKDTAKEVAADYALKFFKSCGFEKSPPYDYRDFV